MLTTSANHGMAAPPALVVAEEPKGDIQVGVRLVVTLARPVDLSK